MSLVAVGACTSARGGTIRADRDPALYTALAAQPLYDSVGMLQVDVFQDGEPAIGSGTLVAPDWVLTAAHVVEEGTTHGVRFTVGGQTYTASRWVSNQKYNGDLVRGYDVALVQLSTAVANVTPAQLYRGHKEFGQVGTFVGFGRTGTGITGDVTDDRLKRAGTNTIDGYLKRGSRGQTQVVQKLKRAYRTFAVDFDDPANPASNRMGSPTPTDLEYLISRGDSGGPTFIDDPTDEQGPVVAGIHSYGEIFDSLDDSSYGDVTAETRASTFAKWVDKVIGNAKYQRKLDFVYPSAPDPSGIVTSALDPAARSIPATGVPEPTGGALASVAALSGLLGRRRRHSRDAS